MPATKRLVLDLPVQTVEVIEARVASGEYSDVNEVVAEAVELFDPFNGSALPDEDAPVWRTWGASVQETLAAVADCREKTYSADEVRRHLEEQRAGGPSNS